MDEEDSTCTDPGVSRDPLFTGDYSFNTGYVKPIAPVDYILLVATLIISILISVYFAWRSKLHMALEEYLVAGRSMTFLPVGLSLLATFKSAIVMIGATAEMYDFNITFLWLGVSFFLMAYLAAHIYVPVFFQLRVATVYEYLEMRFSRGVRTAASFMFVIQTILYMAIALYTPSVVFHSVTGLSLWGSILSVGIVCTIYTTLGGMKAVLWTDSFQIGVVFMSLAVMLYRAVDTVGGLDLVYASAVRTNRIVFWDFRLSPFIRHTAWSVVVGGALVHLCMYGVNHAQIQRCLSCKTLKEAKIAVWMNFPGCCILTYLCCIIGLYMAAFYEYCDPIQAKLVKNSNELFPLFTMDIMGDTRGLPGLILAGVFSATLSTVSSGLNAIAAAILEDHIKLYATRSLEEDRSRLISQIISIVVGAVCLEITYLVSRMGNVLEAATQVFGVIAAPNLGVFSLGLFFPWANAEGALAGLVCSVSAMVWLKLGSMMSRFPPPDKALTCVSKCNISAFRDISWGISQEDQEPPEYSEAESLYNLSYFYIPLFAIIICIAVGLIVSCVTGLQDPQDLDPRLVVSVFDDVYPFHYLPEWIKKYSRFGMDHEGKFERALPERKYSDQSTWRKSVLLFASSKSSSTLTSDYKPWRKSHETAHETGELGNTPCCDNNSQG